MPGGARWPIAEWSHAGYDRVMDDNGTNRRVRTTPVRIARWSIVAIAVVAVLASLRVGALVVLPVVMAFSLALLLWPLHEKVSRRVPAWLSAMCVCGVVILASLVVAWWAWYALSSSVSHFTGQADQLATRYQELRQWLMSLGIPGRWLPTPTNTGQPLPGAPAPQPFFVRMPERARTFLLNIVTGGLGSLVVLAAEYVLSIFLMALALMELRAWRRWFAGSMRTSTWRWVRDNVNDWGRLTRRYFLSTALVGLIGGSATGVWLWTMGISLAWVWAGLTFFMNFIPNVGAFISVVPPVVLAFLEHGFVHAAIVAAGLIAIQMLTGNLLAPMLSGKFIQLSPFVVLMSLVFWGWLWGVVGAVLAPVLTAAIVHVIERIRVERSSRTAMRAGGVVREPNDLRT